MAAFAVSMQSPATAPSAAAPSYALRGAAAPAAPETGYSTSTIGVAALSAAAASMLQAGRKRKAGRTQKALVKSRGGEAIETIPVMSASPATTEINYYNLDEIDTPKIIASMKSALKAMKGKIVAEGPAEDKLSAALCDEDVMSALVSMSRLPVFSKEFGTAFKDDLDLLHALKQIKYFWNLPQSQIAILMSQVAKQLEGPGFAAEFEAFTEELGQSASHLVAIKEVSKKLPAEVHAKYMANAAYLEDADSHAVYPTSIYRQCDALTLATPDAATIESVMSTTITTTIKIARNVLDPSNHLLFDVYKPLGRCVAVVDDKVDKYYGTEIDNYFAANDIEFTKLVFSGNEVDKGIEDVERILVAMKKYRVGRHEPLLVIGGGVIADIAGFATSLYSRNTPYVMLCTSIVSGIDAGPSPRVCCNGFDYKNLYGSYHPPVLTITDRGFWKTLHPGWLRHGVAEIIKMAVMKDLSLFELMEKHGPRAVQTKFGTEGDSVDDAEFQDVCDLIVGKAMEGYVRSEYGNLWETHQCRPHAYGHTWCPGYELPAGMLHGQAVGTDMGFGAYLSYVEGWVSEGEMHRVLKCISDCELSLYHPIMDDDEMVWKTHLGIVEKRGGNLCAPIPRPVGFSGYLNDMTQDMLAQRMHEYKELVSKYPRGGRGVEELCVEVGLEDPQSKKMQKRAAAELAEVAAGKLVPDRFVVTPTDRVATKLSQATAQNDTAAVAEAVQMLDGVDTMVAKYSSQPSDALRSISVQTARTNPMWAEAEETGDTSRLMEAEMISGQAEGQLLQLLVKFGQVRRVLDIGTFTGYSSLAMAEALPEDGHLVTLEREEVAARMAAENWEASPHKAKIESRVGEAQELLQALGSEGASFDLVFLDVDKPGYLALYKTIMDSGLLRVGGLLAVDNTMYKGEELSGEQLSVNGEGARALNEGLLADERVHQVMLPLRDGLTLAFRQR